MEIGYLIETKITKKKKKKRLTKYTIWHKFKPKVYSTS